MADDKEKTPDSNIPDLKDDIIDNLFTDDIPDPKDTVTPPVVPSDKKPIVPDNKDDKTQPVDVDAIVKQAVAAAVKATREELASTTSKMGREQQVTNFFQTEDGKNFIAYKEQIEKAATDPRFSGLSVEQIPAAILKRNAYEKILIEARNRADKNAMDGKIGGDSARAQDFGDTPPDFANMTKKEFADWNANNKKNIKHR